MRCFLSHRISCCELNVNNVGKKNSEEWKTVKRLKLQHVLKLKFLIYIVPFHRLLIVSKSLYNNINNNPPGSSLSLCHSSMRRSHPLSDQLPGEHTGHLAAISWFPSQCNEPIWNTYSANHLHLPGTHFTNPWRDGRLSQPASSGARTRHLSHKSQTCC